MTAWSDYLRQQAIVADRVAAGSTTTGARKEFMDIAASYRRDADIEDGASSATDLASQLPRRNH